MTDVFKDYTNPDGTAVEFRILEPTLSVLNLPMPIEARYVKFKIQDYIGAPCIKLEVMGCTRLECLDINECAVNNGGCDQKCINRYFNYLYYFFVLIWINNWQYLIDIHSQFSVLEISHVVAM